MFVPELRTDIFCQNCGADFDETGPWMHEGKHVCYICWCNLNGFNTDEDVYISDTRIPIHDIPEESWNMLREDYQDELSVMHDVDKDELDWMVLSSK